MAQYRQNETEISLSMLLEVVDALKGYGTDLVIVGGRAPYLLLQKFGAKDAEEHVGSLDGDLALNFRRIPEEKYETILETLARIGYAQRTNAAGKPIPASFQKTINVGEVPFTMQIDFPAGEYGGTAKSHRHQKVQDMLAHKGRGAGLVFDNFYTDELQTRFLSGVELRVRVNVADEVAVFAMKGIAIGQRTKAKDYYDLYMLAKLANLLDEYRASMGRPDYRSHVPQRQRRKHGYGQVSPARDSSGSRSHRATLVWLARFPPRDRLQPLSVGRKRKDRAADSASRQAARHQRPLHQGF